VPLPDASKRSPRVYTNLQNTDLGTVSFESVEATGDPIMIEEANEDELRRIVLVNLARMCVAGEWTGLLEAGNGGGGGNEFNAELTAYEWNGTDTPVRIMALPPFGCVNRIHTTIAGSNNNLIWHPFISPVTGTISKVDIYVGADSGGTGAIDLGFYSDNNGVPKTFLGEFVLATTSTGIITQTVSSADVDTVRGTQYWIGQFFDSMASQPSFTNIEITTAGTSAICTAANGVSAPDMAIIESDASGTGNHTVTDLTGFLPTALDPINIGVKW